MLQIFFFSKINSNKHLTKIIYSYFVHSELPEQFLLLQTPLKFLQPSPKENSTTIFPSALIEFVVWLDPPVYVSENVAREIGNGNFAGFVNKGN